MTYVVITPCQWCIHWTFCDPSAIRSGYWLPDLDMSHFNTSQFGNDWSTCVPNSGGIIVPTSTTRNVVERYSEWDNKNEFKWKQHLKYSSPDWQPLNCILATWPLGPCDYGKLPKITIPVNQVKFAKDNLQCCELAKGQMDSMPNAPPTIDHGLTCGH